MQATNLAINPFLPNIPAPASAFIASPSFSHLPAEIIQSIAELAAGPATIINTPIGKSQGS